MADINYDYNTETMDNQEIGTSAPAPAEEQASKKPGAAEYAMITTSAVGVGAMLYAVVKGVKKFADWTKNRFKPAFDKELEKQKAAAEAEKSAEKPQAEPEKEKPAETEEKKD